MSAAFNQNDEFRMRLAELLPNAVLPQLMRVDFSRRDCFLCRSCVVMIVLHLSDNGRFIRGRAGTCSQGARRSASRHCQLEGGSLFDVRAVEGTGSYPINPTANFPSSPAGDDRPPTIACRRH